MSSFYTNECRVEECSIEAVDRGVHASLFGRTPAARIPRRNTQAIQFLGTRATTLSLGLGTRTTTRS